MDLHFCMVPNAKHLKTISASSTYGIGLLTSIAQAICNLFGLECAMYDDKIEKAKNSAAKKLIKKAQEVNAVGIMDIKIEMYRTTILMYGIAYQ